MILGAVLIAPFLTLEMMTAPRAGVGEPIHIVQPSVRSQGSHGGDGLPAPAGRKGNDGTPRRAPRRAAAEIVPPEAQPVRVPLTPPDPSLTTDVTRPQENDPGAGDDADNRAEGVPGDPNGEGNGTIENPDGCPGCVGRGSERGPGRPGTGDDPIDAWTPGLTPPELIPGSRALPKYPDVARRARVEGSVILMIVIDPDGRVGEVEVIRSTDQRWGFDFSAIEAVKRWRYRPASMYGRAVTVLAQVMVEFSLSR